MPTQTKPWTPSNPQLLGIKLLLIILSLLPLLRLFGDLGANPPEFVSRHTGTWTFNFLLLTLLVSPLRAWTGLHWLVRLRRSLGLLTFLYATLHFASFALFDHELDIQEISQDILDRPFIAVGFTAYMLMVPLALTSSNWAISRLGGKRWKELHRSIYLIGILAAIHDLWLTRITAYFYPLTYVVLLTILLGWRVLDYLKRARAPAQHQARVPQASGPQTIRFFKEKPGE